MDKVGREPGMLLATAEAKATLCAYIGLSAWFARSEHDTSFTDLLRASDDDPSAIPTAIANVVDHYGSPNPRVASQKRLVIEGFRAYHYTDRGAVGLSDKHVSRGRRREHEVVMVGAGEADITQALALERSYGRTDMFLASEVQHGNGSLSDSERLSEFLRISSHLVDTLLQITYE